jgi:hypothetical protein
LASWVNSRSATVTRGNSAFIPSYYEKKLSLLLTHNTFNYPFSKYIQHVFIPRAALIRKSTNAIVIATCHRHNYFFCNIHNARYIIDNLVNNLERADDKMGEYYIPLHWKLALYPVQ